MTITADAPVIDTTEDCTVTKPTFTIDLPATMKHATMVEMMKEAGLLNVPEPSTFQPSPYRGRRMNPVVKTEWVAALRSGKFPQSQGQLRKQEGYCCLGVLTELARRHGVVDRVIYSDMTRTYRYDGEHNFPPPAVVRWAGLPSHDPVIYDHGGRTLSLAVLNDSLGASFCRIADVIEQQL